MLKLGINAKSQLIFKKYTVFLVVLVECPVPIHCIFPAIHTLAIR